MFSFSATYWLIFTVIPIYVSVIFKSAITRTKENNELMDGWMDECSLYPLLQQQQDSVVWDQFHFLFEALHAHQLIIEGDLSEAGTVEIRRVVHPGLSQHRLQPAGLIRYQSHRKRQMENMRVGLVERKENIKSLSGKQTRDSFLFLIREKKGSQWKQISDCALTCHRVSPLWCWGWRCFQSYTDSALPHWAYRARYSP